MELYPLGISCQERVCGVFTDLSGYSLSKTPCSNCLLGSWPNTTETALWIEQDCPRVSVLFCSWMWPSAMTGEKAREPKHMNSWVQPVSPPPTPASALWNQSLRHHRSSFKLSWPACCSPDVVPVPGCKLPSSPDPTDRVPADPPPRLALLCRCCRCHRSFLWSLYVFLKNTPFDSFGPASYYISWSVGTSVTVWLQSPFFTEV